MYKRFIIYSTTSSNLELTNSLIGLNKFNDRHWASTHIKSMLFKLFSALYRISCIFEQQRHINSASTLDQIALILRTFDYTIKTSLSTANNL
jgi:hypothetical protein